MSKQLAVFRDDAHVEVRQQDDHSLVTVGAPHDDVVELAPVAQGDRAPLVDVVVTDLGLGENRLALELRCCLVERSPRLQGRTTPSLVGSLLDVGEDEAVDLLLQGRDGRDRALLAQPLLQRLWQRSTLPRAWRW